MIGNKQEYDKMAKCEQELWWYKSLHNLVLRHIQPCFHNKKIAILDAGCGTGGLMNFLKQHGYKNIEGFDISQFAVDYCNELGLQVKIGDLQKIDQLYFGKKYDVIVSNDTLCYFDESTQVAIVEKMKSMLNENGLIVLNVPALEAFGGIHDKAVGIVERFSPSKMKNLSQKSALEIQDMLFWPFLLSPLIFFVRLIQRLKLKFNKNTKIKSDVSLPPKFLNTLLYWLIKLENSVFRKKPFGSSLFVVLK